MAEHTGLREEFFRSVASRLTPVEEDYDQFLIRKDAPGIFRLCIEMTGIYSMERPWFLTADNNGCTFWRHGGKVKNLTWVVEGEPTMISDKEQFRARQAVGALTSYMRKTSGPSEPTVAPTLLQEMTSTAEAQIAPKKDLILERVTAVVVKQMQEKWAGPDAPIYSDLSGIRLSSFFDEKKGAPSRFMVLSFICTEFNKDPLFKEFKFSPHPALPGIVATPI